MTRLTRIEDSVKSIELLYALLIFSILKFRWKSIYLKEDARLNLDNSIFGMYCMFTYAD